MEETILTAVSTVGFPIVVTFYLLTRFQTSMDNFTAQLGELVGGLRRRELKQGTMFEGTERRANMCESLSQVAARRA